MLFCIILKSSHSVLAVEEMKFWETRKKFFFELKHKEEHENLENEGGETWKIWKSKVVSTLSLFALFLNSAKTSMKKTKLVHRTLAKEYECSQYNIP
jgi:hypothetical protein